MFQELLDNELSDEQIRKISSIEVGSASTAALTAPLNTLRKIVEKAQLAQEYIVPSTTTAAQNALNQMRSAYQELLNVDLANAGNPASFISQKVEAISTRCNELIALLLPIAAISVEFDSKKLSNYEKQAARSLEEIQDFKSKAASFIETQAVAGGWEYFNEKASEYKHKVRNFSVALGCSIGAAIIIVILFSRTELDLTSTQSTAKSLFPVVNILAISWFVINLFSRNIRSYQHLQVLNESKATILQSGLVLMAASKDNEDNSDLRTAVFQNSFSISELGILRHEKEPNSFGNSGLVGLVKNMNSR